MLFKGARLRVHFFFDFSCVQLYTTFPGTPFTDRPSEFSRHLEKKKRAFETVRNESKEQRSDFYSPYCLKLSVSNRPSKRRRAGAKI